MATQLQLVLNELNVCIIKIEMCNALVKVFNKNWINQLSVGFYSRYYSHFSVHSNMETRIDPILHGFERRSFLINLQNKTIALLHNIIKNLLWWTNESRIFSSLLFFEKFWSKYILFAATWFKKKTIHY